MYNHQEIEKKWQERWKETNLYQTGTNWNKPKYYVLDMFPYPSGAGLHVGHPKGYIATDILARLRLMQGYNVLHPMGWDAFGLPAENYAIKNKVHPQDLTVKNVNIFKHQLEILGLAYDWTREINTTDPEYYKWTQWIFLKMWKKGLAYESYAPINWCPSCQTGLANEDVEDGRCERCGTLVELKPVRQWVLKITDYAERLLNDLDKLPGWEEAIKEMQRNWIGRSSGAEVEFKINTLNSKNYKSIKVFTTRVDTIFACTYLVLAPENKVVQELKAEIKNWSAVAEYIKKIKNKSDLERTALNKEKSGIILEGVKALNPFNQELVPIFIADYVLNSYGTGAIMAVPAHDSRDWEFAKKYNLEIRSVISPFEKVKKSNLNDSEIYKGEGILKNSGEFSGLDSVQARKKMISYLKKNKIGSKKINYKLKDWVFSRQRYWGEPIPLVHCPHCGIVPLPEKDLPLTLPQVKNYAPSGTGESPLATIDDWVNTTCPKCGGPAKRETNTMPQWGGSCWYYLRYIDPHNNHALVDKTKEKYWSPVDFYVGGAEHATRHLIYARFWYKFLFDIGVVNYDEPFLKFKHVGLIMAEDGRKMSKRWGNVINPDEIVQRFGADALRIYEMFMGPFGQAISWDTNGLVGARKFLEKLNSLFSNLRIETKKYSPSSEQKNNNKKLLSLIHKTIKKVEEDIESFNFNTAISALMILVNELTAYYKKWGNNFLDQKNAAYLLKIIAPFAPHLSEELWEKLGNKESIFKASWPQYDSKLIKTETINLVIQINGKLRTRLDVAADISEEEVLKLLADNEIIRKWLVGKKIIKNIFVPGRLLNIVVK